MTARPNYKRNIVIAILLMSFILIAGAWLTFNEATDRNETVVNDKAVRSHFKVFKKKDTGDLLPPVSVMSLNGDSVSLEKNEGKFTVLNIWATWCTPCIKELPSLQRLSHKLNGDWRVMAVSIDAKTDKIEGFTVKTDSAEIANYHDTNMELQEAINVIQLPVTYIVDDQSLYDILYVEFGVSKVRYAC